MFCLNVWTMCVDIFLFFSSAMKGIRIGISYTFKYTPFNKIDENLPREATTADESNRKINAIRTLQHIQKPTTFRKNVQRKQIQVRGVANANREDTFAIPKCHLMLLSFTRSTCWRAITLRRCSFLHQIGAVAAWASFAVQVPCYYNRGKYISHIMAMCWFDRDEIERANRNDVDEEKNSEKI